MRLNQLRRCMHADFHRKSFAQTAILDSRADDSGFARRFNARIRVARKTIAANGRFLPGEWQYGTACVREPIENPATGMRGIGRLCED
jgi:hypothetical protein